jgi:hypothetical protein
VNAISLSERFTLAVLARSCGEDGDFLSNCIHGWLTKLRANLASREIAFQV